MLDRNSKTPLYQQLKITLLKYIEENLNEGDSLPIESEIEKMYGVSRITVRKTIEDLEKDGIVMKHQGRGTFVQSKKIIQDAGTITSWTEEMKSKGKTIETINLHISEIEPSRKLIGELKLDKGEKIICLRRIRCADGEPIAIMVNYIRSKYVPGFLEKGLTKESLYEELEVDYQIQLESARERIQARIATDLEAVELHIPPYSAVLHITRTSFLPDGTPFEVVEMTNRSDRYQYDIHLNGRNKYKS
ncbi:GntR family transcriptional regulator [Heyndrickxia oleronia]|jgi:GntR family transcriptional regulator|uniref:GntR family transcriptional regulator n=1 Tax=Heyndrickxia oleronia TaxID=38875 RepID=A0A8E2IDK5_9BACI|nr:GntR family transcriptional regulator [Heyndrickxia oleronia]MBU5211565.1 GntR family transcriptional regulator [Heyndrickxia oleronia]MCM3454994.1 GntR family transcriptional regulator [Heyndrickxia oleronia]MEC1375932.1 GntR family transcriptional regulator [Heyndrickxia oleronia]OOP69448.1 GntR family transcriptional regulator [Heyndrickxia oleronia]QQZ05639.1 GntR family transcriptional regulator [Heyndrickxia oleronia]